MDFRLERRVNVGSSVMTNAPLWWDMSIMGKLFMCGRWELPALPAQFCCETKTAIKIKSLDKNKELYKCIKKLLPR